MKPKLRMSPPEETKKILILTMNPDNYSCRRLLNSATSRGHRIELKYTLDCRLDETNSQTGVSYLGEPLKYIDAVIPRFGPSVTKHGTSILEQLEKMNIPSLNSAAAIKAVRNKKLFLKILREASITTPLTLFPEDFDSETNLVDALGGFPAVVKSLDSARGEGIYLAENQKQYRSLTETLRPNNIRYYVQPFHSESNFSDIRYLILGNKILAKMKRQAAKGEFRSNLFQGGTAANIPSNHFEEQVALKAIRAAGLMFAAVDFLRTTRGPLLLEINVSPGFEGLESLTNLDLAGEIIEYVDKLVELSRDRV